MPILDGALRTAHPSQPVLTNHIPNHYNLKPNRNLSKVADHLTGPPAQRLQGGRRVRTPGCFVASISDELYGPILDAVPQQPSPPKDLECIQKIHHQPKQATSNFNTGWDIPILTDMPAKGPE